MVTILDGGMGGEIQKHLEGANHGLWSAKALIEAPDLVRSIHQAYVDAGARIIITNTYSTIPSYLGKEGQAEAYLDYCQLAGEIARSVADQTVGVQVAGSLPPLSESYRPDLVPDAALSVPIYESMVQTLNPFVDLYMCETMSTADEAFNAASAAKRCGEGRPVFVAWTLNETPGVGLRSLETVEVAFQRVAELNLDGFLFNCTTPEAVLPALETLRGLTEKPIGCYVNRIEKVPEAWTLDNDKQTGRRTDLTQQYYVELSLAAIAAGADIVGGCCGIGPEDIAALAQAVGREPAA
jgi:S-methylmethionine-dependent homocysteine/selenocysteine methylase